ncbi:choice-of-anchor J domain-containing protein [Prevotella falsenii]|uniref:choice-of-anchor J domain-containing protein n=1 Tax=Prevotella falsenii TaxID=515414 RepID=UPI000B25D4CE|nr:choice-of-anchor J domain-containing protein [Prevotella falsenii]
MLTEVVPLEGFENERYIFVGFKAIGGNNRAPIFVDNIRVMEVQRHNLAVTVSGTGKVIKGRNAKLNVRVENIGEKEAEEFTVRIKSGDKEIVSSDQTEALASFNNRTLTFDVPTSAIIKEAKEMKVVAEVEYDKDLDNADNNAEFIIRLEDSEKPKVRDLRGIREKSKVSLIWRAPNTEPQTVTEDFERYDAWSTEFGDWTLVDGNKGYAGGFFNDLWYPNQFTQFAYIIFNPYVLGEDVPRLNPWLLAFSGKQYAAVPYELDATGQAYVNSDNWIISPKLSGQAQTISFYAHNMVVNNAAYIEDYDVLCSTTGNKVADFTNIVVKNRQAISGEWEKITIDIPAGTTYFAIHQKTPQTGLMFGIDDVTFTKETPVPTHYGIYREGERIDKVPDIQFYYVDNAAGNSTRYAVTAIYADGTESAPVEVSVATGIDNIVADGKPFDVYTIDGKLVRRQTTTLRGLRKGVYVVGNKK